MKFPHPGPVLRIRMTVPHHASFWGVGPVTQAILTEHWTKLILSYATGGFDWNEVVRDPRINRTHPLAGALLYLYYLH